MIKTPLVILAGGQALRMGKCAIGVAKCSLPIYNTSLLLRQIRQATGAGYRRIIVSTNKIFYPNLKKQLEDFKFVHVFSNINHKCGSLAALLRVIEKTKSHRMIMSLADIFFLKNPFDVVSKYLNKKEIFLFVAKAFDKRELGRGGIVWSNSKKKVIRIFEPAIPQNPSGFRWSGLVIFDTAPKKNLRIFLKKNYLAPEENFFSYLLTSEESIKIDFVSDFLNVNTPQQLLLASLYQAAEDADADPLLQKTLLSAAINLRKSLLREIRNS